MPQEIERKFLVDPAHPELAAILRGQGLAIRQAYLRDPSAVVVRLSGGAGALRIASGQAEPIEVAIPAEDATELMGGLCRPKGGDYGLDGGIARIRIAGDRAWLTIKGKTSGISRAEFEYPLAPDLAEALLGECGAVLRKSRFTHPLAEGLLVEIDVFEQIDLVLAEVELPDAAVEFGHPSWFTREVSDDPAYFNNAIAERLAAGA